MSAYPTQGDHEPEGVSSHTRVQMRLSGAIRVAVSSGDVTLALADEAATPAGALQALCERYPRTRRYLLDPNGTLLPGVRLLLNDVRLDGNDMERVRLRDGDRLSVLLAVAGG